MRMFLKKVMKPFCAQEQKESFSSQIILYIGFDVHLNSDEISPTVEKKHLFLSVAGSRGMIFLNRNRLHVSIGCMSEIL